jgi:hypothetical protein
MDKVVRVYIIIASALLLVTGSAKLISSAGHAPFLDVSDDLLPISTRLLFVIVGIMELLLGSMGLLRKQNRLTLMLIGCLASEFILYRAGLLWLGIHKPCKCLGSIADTFGLSEHFFDRLSFFILIYLIVGSYTLLAIMNLHRGLFIELRKTDGHDLLRDRFVSLFCEAQ